MNLGIVVGVSDYMNASKLPGCEADARAVKKLCGLTNKCNDILYITENTESQNVKSKIAAFIKKYEDEEVEEVIFYFSGHGLFTDNEFFYVLTDYSENRIRQTSLENSELDNLLRSLNAEVTVKIVDACQSGTRYVKDPDVFRKYLQDSESGFKKCYFFYSSQNNQYSYQTSEISDFTHSFLNAFIDRPEQEVRYKDVMDSLADEFSGNNKQTPFFVMQGNYTEIFSYISQEVANELIKTTKINNYSEDIKDTQKTLVQLVEEEANLYCEKDEAISCVEKIEKVVQSYSFNTDIDDLFEIIISKEVDAQFPVPTEHIGKSLENNTIDYMAKINKESRVRKVPKTGRLAGLIAAGALLNSQEVPMEDEYYQVAIGAESTVELPFKFLTVRFKAKYPNVNDTGCIISPFVSQTKINLFSAFYTYRNREWDVKTINQKSVKWIDFEEFIKKPEELKDSIEVLLEEFSSFSIRPIKKSFNLLEVAQEDE
ncbi:caspase domain-containing protein [Microbulbifer sp. ANSA003]|uniref:caspase family protein n=1 Tax=Microbulbifer sp. ANSA003 TaxID=3243360 RepID=UPI00404130E3